MPIVFAAIAPHPPIILPSIGSKKDKKDVKETIEGLDFLAKEIEKEKPDLIVISSPHHDWGFNVPLHFLTKDFKGEIEKVLIEMELPQFYFEKGKKIGEKLFSVNKKYALIASGDLSHCLKENGPYGFHPDGPKFDKQLIGFLKNKDIKSILELDNKYPEAAECGLRSICFVLGILEFSGINYEPRVLSYQAPFGVGYLVVNFKIT